VSKRYIDDRIDPVRSKVRFIQPPATKWSVIFCLCNGIAKSNEITLIIYLDQLDSIVVVAVLRATLHVRNATPLCKESSFINLPWLAALLTQNCMRFQPHFRSCIPGHRDPESWARILGKAPQVSYARMRRVEVGARVGVSLTEA
jgi:hypothetical protein